jgi:zinc/manganese transport system substrate-binding protein
MGGQVEVVELYTGSLGEPGSGADTYLGFMTIDADRIAAALN